MIFAMTFSLRLLLIVFIARAGLPLQHLQANIKAHTSAKEILLLLFQTLKFICAGDAIDTLFVLFADRQVPKHRGDAFTRPEQTKYRSHLVVGNFA